MLTEVTHPVCPIKVLISCPVSISQSLSVLSAEPERAYFPSGEMLTELTSAVCPEKVIKFFSGFYIPEFKCTIC